MQWSALERSIALSKHIDMTTVEKLRGFIQKYESLIPYAEEQLKAVEEIIPDTMNELHQMAIPPFVIFEGIELILEELKKSMDTTPIEPMPFTAISIGQGFYYKGGIVVKTKTSYSLTENNCKGIDSEYSVPKNQLCYPVAGLQTA